MSIHKKRSSRVPSTGRPAHVEPLEVELVSLALRLLFSKVARLHHLFAHAIRITLNRTKAHSNGSAARTHNQGPHQNQTPLKVQKINPSQPNKERS